MNVVNKYLTDEFDPDKFYGRFQKCLPLLTKDDKKKIAQICKVHINTVYKTLTGDDDNFLVQATCVSLIDAKMKAIDAEVTEYALKLKCKIEELKENENSNI